MGFKTSLNISVLAAFIFLNAAVTSMWAAEVGEIIGAMTPQLYYLLGV